MFRTLRSILQGLRPDKSLLVLACGFPLALSPAAAQAPSIIVNYDVLNSLADMPAGAPKSRIEAEGAAPSIFAVPESRLLIRPEKKAKSAATARRTAAPAQAAPRPRAKPSFPKTPAVEKQAAKKQAVEKQEEAPPSALASAADSDRPATAATPAQSAPESTTAAPSALPVPPPPPEPPQLADLTSTDAPAPPSAAELPALPEPPAETAETSTAAAEDSGEPAADATRQALRILFDLTSVKLSDDAKAALSELAESLRDDGDRRVELRAHATESEGGARRTSLTRARAVRSFLVDKGVASTRIDVRPLGATSKGGPPDRVDIVDARR